MKSDKSVKKQEFDVQSLSSEAHRKDVSQAPLNPSCQGGSAVFEELVPDSLIDQIAVVSAEQVAFHAVELPVRSARQRLSALPYALEDHIGSSLDRCHFALCGTVADTKHLAAILDALVLEDFIAAFPDKQVVAEQMLLAPPDVGEGGLPVWHVYRREGRALVRSSDKTGFAVDADMLPMLWERAGRPKIESSGAPLPGGVPSIARALTEMPAVSVLENDLRQGVFQPARGFAPPLRWLAACILMAGLLHLVLAMVDVRAQRDLANDLRGKAATALASRLPSASPDAAPSLILRQIAAQNQPQRGSSFLPMLDEVAQALVQQPDGVQFRKLNWSEEGLRLAIEAPDLDALQKVETALKARGLRVASGSATAEGGAARAELTVQK